VTVDILSVSQLTSRTPENIGTVSRRSVIEQEQSPCTMDHAGLLERTY